MDIKEMLKGIKPYLLAPQLDTITNLSNPKKPKRVAQIIVKAMCDSIDAPETIELYHDGRLERIRYFVERSLATIFKNAKIDVKEDTYAAVFATTNPSEKAIVCILGTGSNCSFWNGKELYQAVDSLGYILMDESSGNFYGKRLIIDYYFKKMPADLVQKFESQYELGSDVVKNHLYKMPNPNSYLATFAKFIVENKNHEYCRAIVKKGMQLFVDHWISQYEERYEVPINFVGSIAFFLQDILEEVLAENKLKLGTVLRKPIDGLVAFHVNNYFK